MKITKIYNSTDALRKLNTQELKIGQKVLKTNLGLKSNESLLIVTDPQMEKKEAAIWFEAGKTITPKTQMIVFSGMTENAQEPPKKVAQMMKQANVSMLQTSKSLSHTQARKKANDKGARIASLPTTTYDIILRTLGIDYKPVEKLGIKLAKLITQAKTATIIADNSTNITMGISRQGRADTGIYTKPGQVGNLPAGEGYIAPDEGTTEGIFIIDASFADIYLDKPIRLTVKKGYVIDIRGGKAASKLTHLVNKIGKKARNIAELGIGTNPACDPKGKLIEAEKAYGTVHLALGSSAAIGGTIQVPFHSDGVLLKPTLKLHNQVIIKKGKFIL